MILIKNRQFQPLTFHLADQTTLHLQPRQQTRIADNLVSPELEAAAVRHFISMGQIPEPPKPRKRRSR